MRLQPKARPVQISKLRLGGVDINTIYDLLDNFRVAEIIELGDKFTQWLSRSQGYSGEEIRKIEQVLYGTMPMQDKTFRLLDIFISSVFKNIQSMKDYVLKYRAGKDDQLYSRILGGIDADAQFAMELMNKVPTMPGVAEWLRKCANKGRHTGEFYFEYAKYLEDRDDKAKAKEWLKRAAALGHHEAKMRLNANLKVDVKGHIIEMVRVGEIGGFYIAKHILPSAMFNNHGTILENGQLSKSVFGHGEPCWTKGICTTILQNLNQATKYKWSFATKEQWEMAAKANAIIISKYERNSGAWIKEVTAGVTMINPARYKGDNRNNIFKLDSADPFCSTCCLRPVIKISENPSLQ